MVAQTALMEAYLPDKLASGQVRGWREVVVIHIAALIVDMLLVVLRVLCMTQAGWTVASLQMVVGFLQSRGQEIAMDAAVLTSSGEGIPENFA